MSNFVTDLTSLADGKANLRPRTGSVANSVDASEWNALVQACYDLRTYLLAMNTLEFSGSHGRWDSTGLSVDNGWQLALRELDSAAKSIRITNRGRTGQALVSIGTEQADSAGADLLRIGLSLTDAGPGDNTIFKFKENGDLDMVSGSTLTVGNVSAGADVDATGHVAAGTDVTVGALLKTSYFDGSGTPGDVDAGAAISGLAVLQAGHNVVTVTTTAAEAGCVVLVSPLSIDANVAKWCALATTGLFQFQTNVNAAADLAFSWLIVRS